MRISAFIFGLSAVALAQQNNSPAPDATDVAASMAAAASSANAAALSDAQAAISSQRAHQTLSGEAASQAAHNSAVLASGLAAQTSLKSQIKSAEASVRSEEAEAKKSLSMLLATATGMWCLRPPRCDSSTNEVSLGDVAQTVSNRLSSITAHATNALQSISENAANPTGGSSASASSSGPAAASDNFAKATGVPIAAAAVGGLFAVVGLL